MLAVQHGPKRRTDLHRVISPLCLHLRCNISVLNRELQRDTDQNIHCFTQKIQHAGG